MDKGWVNFKVALKQAIPCLIYYTFWGYTATYYQVCVNRIQVLRNNLT